MALTFLNATGTGLGVNGGTTAGVTTTGANLLVLSVTYFATITVSDSKANSWTALTERTAGAGNARHRFYYVRNPSVGTGHTFTITGTGIYTAVVVHWYADTAGAPTFESENGAAAASGTSRATGSVTPTTNGSLVVSGLALANTETPSVDSGLTATVVNGIGGVALGCTLARLIQSPAAAINPTWTWASSTDNAASVAVFKPVVASERVEPFVMLPV